MKRSRQDLERFSGQFATHFRDQELFFSSCCEQIVACKICLCVFCCVCAQSTVPRTSLYLTMRKKVEVHIFFAEKKLLRTSHKSL